VHFNNDSSTTCLQHNCYPIYFFTIQSGLIDVSRTKEDAAAENIQKEAPKSSEQKIHVGG